MAADSILHKSGACRVSGVIATERFLSFYLTNMLNQVNFT